MGRTQQRGLNIASCRKKSRRLMSKRIQQRVHEATGESRYGSEENCLQSSKEIIEDIILDAYDEPSDLCHKVSNVIDESVAVDEEFIEIIEEIVIEETKESDEIIIRDIDEKIMSRNNISSLPIDSNDDSLIIEKVDSDAIVDNSLPTGRRIVDMAFFFTELQKEISTHSRGIACGIENWKHVKTIRRGLLTQMFFKCDMCHYKCSIWSESTSNSNTLDVNKAAVMGTITTGVGYSQLEELLAAMDIPNMSERSYSKYMEDTVDNFMKSAYKEMIAAGEAERKLAIEKGDVVHGIPYITVVLDGSWMKRSYGTNFNSLSCVGAILGHRTGKVLFIGIRNKYCAICDGTKMSSNFHPRPHICYKNFDRLASSSRMESDAIVEGFKCSVEMHGLIYRTFIADGDSNVHKSIRDNDPYREQMVEVKKIECTNHLLRNCCKKLRTIADMPQPKGKRNRGYYDIRNIVKRNIMTIREAVINAAAFRREENSSNICKEAKLQKDILNIPKHVFGEHLRCKDRCYNGKCNEMDKKNNVPYLKTHGLYDKIEHAIRYLSAHSDSLLLNATSNSAESFHSIVCKTIGGKRINYGSRGSYNARVSAAVLQFNKQQVLTEMYKNLCDDVPSTVVKLETGRQDKIERTRTSRSEKGRSNTYDSIAAEKNIFYGHHSQKPDLSEDVFNRLREHHFEKLNDNLKKSIEIEHETRNQADSELWISIRKYMLTASNFGGICRMRETTSCACTVKKILFPPLLDTVAMKFGRDNEKNARECLEKKLNKEIKPCGLFIDHDIPYLGASPDGLIDDDELAEIKCPFSAENMSAEEAIENCPHLRSIFDKNNNNKMNIRHPHYYQVQGQLHITQREYCIYTIWTAKSIFTLRVARDDEFWQREMKEKLIRFYEQCLLPEIIDSRYKRNMPIREPLYILDAQEKTRMRKTNEEIKGISKACRKRKMVEENAINDLDENCSSPEIVEVECKEVSISERRKIIDKASAPLKNIIQNVLPSNGKLNDESLDRFLRVIRETSDFETQSVLYLAYTSLVEPSKSSKSIQIIGGNCSDHWRCIFFDGCKLYVYDSLPSCTYEKLTKEEREYIALRYPLIKESKMIFPKVHIQPDCWSCGIYAAAFAATIALGMNPIKKRYSNDVNLMRDHFIEIIRKNKLSEFPTM